MKFCKNLNAYRRWVRREHPSDVLSFGEPEEFPCFVYTIVTSFAYEEESPVFIYRRDLEGMLKQMTNSAPTTTEA